MQNGRAQSGDVCETYEREEVLRDARPQIARSFFVYTDVQRFFFLPFFLSFFQPSHSPALLFENGCNERGRSITLERSYLYLMKSASSSSSSNFLDPLLRFQKCVKFEGVGFETVEFKYVKKRRKFRKLENSKYVNKFTVELRIDKIKNGGIRKDRTSEIRKNFYF